MTPLLAWAVLCGVGLGFGAWSLVSLIPLLNRPRLIFRLAPYLVDISPVARELLARRAVDPLPVAGTLVGPVVGAARRLLDRTLGGAETLRRRLRQAGSSATVESFRSRQLGFAASGLLLGALVAVAAGSAQSISPVMQAGLAVTGAAGGIVVCDKLLARAATRRVSQMANELPTVLEFLTLSLSAGEGIVDGVRRISTISRGELASELAGTVGAVGAGVPFAVALQRLSDDLGLPAFSRTVEQIVGALERGTPLVEVLRAQAGDTREEGRRDLLETAGKKEVAMLVPLVFLILPLTIVFAIWPGLFVLRLGF